MKNAAIVYLTRSKDFSVFVSSVVLLYRNFCNTFRYPVLVYHDDLSDAQIITVKDILQNQNGCFPDIEFIRLNFVTPSDVSTDPSLYEHPQKYPISLQHFGMGYRHMCRFFSGKMFEHPSTAKYKYIWRIDSDSFILSKITRDPFEVMEQNQYDFADLAVGSRQTDDGWMYTDKEVFWAREELAESTFDFIKSTDIQTNKFTSYDGELFNSNLMVLNLDFFRSSSYKSFFQFMDKTKKFFYKRWGDNCFLWLGIRLFSSPE
jgi:mannosyltransferase